MALNIFGFRRRGRHRVKRAIFWACVALTGIAAFYVAYLDYTVREKFDGNRWQIPSRVYARPMELYVGKKLTLEHLVLELQALRYSNIFDSRRSASYTRQGSGVQINTRGFRFMDGEESSQRVNVQFEQDTIVTLSNAENNDAIDLVRLDPVFIGAIYPAKKEDRILVKFDEVPPLLVKSLLAVEDQNYYEHAGIVVKSIVRATLANIKAGRSVQGGSTLTQQLVKNFYLSSEKTVTRKLNEAVMSLLLELHYAKNDILEVYLNEIYLAQDGNTAVHGIGLASQFYFNKSADQLELHEIALLIGLVQGPSYFDPRRYPERALKRRNLVLDVIARNNIASSQTVAAAKRKSLGVSREKLNGTSPYPAFLDLVKRQLKRDYNEQDLTGSGLQLYTTLDPIIQRGIEDAAQRQLKRIEQNRKSKHELQIASVVTDSITGDVLAVVGDRNFRYAGFNRALDAYRPIGSLVKPAVYLTALQSPDKYHLATLLDDSPMDFSKSDWQTWTPENYDGLYHGQVPLYSALAHSYNIATIRLGLNVGLDNVLQTLHALGMERDIEPYPSLLLGAVDMSPFEVTMMYQTLATGGFRTPLRAIREVTRADHTPLSRYPLEVNQAVGADASFLISTALQTVTREGTGKGLYQMIDESINIAGKTGTTNDTRDSWFAGYTGDKLALVWIGTDENDSTGLTGASGAMLVWGDFVSHIETRSLNQTPPVEIRTAYVDPALGTFVDSACIGVVEVPVIAGYGELDNHSCSPGMQQDMVKKTLNWVKQWIQ